MRSPKEILGLLADYSRFIRGADYFRQKQGLGKYFEDSRCFYNDLRGKADWNGPLLDGIPVLQVAASGQSFVFPVTVLLYGVGNMDRFLYDKQASALQRIISVAQWMINNVSVTGDFNNNWIERHSTREFYSNNSALTQGLALAFGVRVIKYISCDANLKSKLGELLVKVCDNMLLPVNQGGTAVYKGEDVFFLEYPRKDNNVVLNGWICGIFGLYDYEQYCPNKKLSFVLNATVKTLAEQLPGYHLSNGWALYDNMGRLCSPFYQDLHVVLLEAMFRLSDRDEFNKYAQISRKANCRINRIRYTLMKALQKLFQDKERLCVGQGRVSLAKS